MKRFFVINPHAGKGISAQTLNQICQFFITRTGSFEHVFTNSKTDIAIQTRIALKNGYEQIVAVGGDGTIQQVANGFFEDGKLINENASLAVSKMGSGSDFFKTVSQGVKNCNWMDLVLNYQTRKVDIGEISIHDGEKKVAELFINMASIGVSADITRKKGTMPSWLPGKMKYLIPTIATIFPLKFSNLLVNSDLGADKDDYVTLFVNKGIYAGGGMKFAPDALHDDGKFEVTIVKKISPFTMLTHIGKLYSGRLTDIPGIKKIRTTQISISSSDSVSVEIDGEYLGKHNITIRVIPQVLNVCFPTEVTVQHPLENFFSDQNLESTL